MAVCFLEIRNQARVAWGEIKIKRGHKSVHWSERGNIVQTFVKDIDVTEVAPEGWNTKLCADRGSILLSTKLRFLAHS